MFYRLQGWDDPRAVFAQFVVQESGGDPATARVTAGNIPNATVAFEVALQFNAVRVFGKLRRLRRTFTIPFIRRWESHSIQADRVDRQEMLGSTVHYGWIDGRPARIVEPEDLYL